jgi:hypothetical protein
VFKHDTDLTPGSGIISGEYSYLGGGPTLMWGGEQGLSAVGYGVFGPGNRFPGGNVADQGNPPGGLDFGLSSAGDDPTTHNGGANRALVKNSVIFTLGGLPAGFNPLVDVTNVTFQYGTNMEEPHITVPEPASASLLVTAGAVLLLRRRHSAR